MHAQTSHAIRRRRRAPFAALAAALLAPAAAFAFFDEEDAEMLERWARAAQAVTPEEIARALDDFDPRLALEILEAAQAALREPTLDHLARLQPYVRLMQAEIRRLPRFAAYAPWVEARVAYFDEARRIVESRRERPAASLSPSRPPSESDRTVWQRRAARRPPARAKDMVPTLKVVFRRQGVPDALVWLAEIESSFNPAARSPAGAVGLYQLMPATARALGLRTDIVPDERFDPIKNADAAARYLAHLHHRFRAWPPALAAYNAGETRVARLLRESNGNFEAIVGRLPAETRMYVPRVIETVRAREGVNLATLPPP